jgi:hypothetical protein
MSQVLGRKRIPVFAIALAVALLLCLATSVAADPPVANDDAYTTDEDTTTVVAAPGLLANDSDPDGDPMIAFVGSPPANGDLTLNPDGGFVYTPTLNFYGVDTFGYLAADGPTPPVAYWPFDDGTDPTADVSGNGHDGDLIGEVAFSTTVPITLGAGLALEFDGASGDVRATGIDLANNSFSVAFWARRDQSGADHFVVSQGTGSQHLGLHIGFRSDDRFTCAFWTNDLDTFLLYTDANWHHWACTYDAASDLRTIYRDGVAVASDTALADYQGSGVLHVGRFLYPGNYFLGLVDDVRIYYQPLSEAQVQAAMMGIPPEGTADRATVSITVTATPDPPVANDDAYAVSDDLILAVAAPGVLGNDYDPDGDVLTSTLNSPATLGGLALNTDGGFVYTPTEGLTGADIVSYTVSDGNAADIGWVTFTVQAVNDAPIAADDVYTTTEDTTLTIPVPGVLANDSDPDGDVLTATLLTPPANGDLTLSPDGGFVYTPTLNWNGVDTFSYLAADGSTPAVVAYWPFDDGADPTADVSGNGHNGDLSGGVVFSTTVPIILGDGLALEFDGASGDVQATGIDLANNSFSVAFWARRDQSGTTYFVVSQGTGTQHNGLHIGFRFDGRFTCAFWANDLDTFLLYTDANWHHWACTYDAASNLRTIYRDGAAVASDFALADYQGSGALHIGNHFGAGGYFLGLVDDVRIYYQPLSEAQVQAAMMGTPPEGIADWATVSIAVTAIEGYAIYLPIVIRND